MKEGFFDRRIVNGLLKHARWNLWFVDMLMKMKNNATSVLEVAREFARLGLYRLAAPKKCLGADADPCTQMAVIETISEFDGSSGWNLMIGMETFGLVGPSMATCLDLIGDPSIIMASSTAAVGSAKSLSLVVGS